MTSYRCNKCMLPMCIDLCWRKYHEGEDYISAIYGLKPICINLHSVAFVKHTVLIDFRIDLAKELIGNYSYRKRELANVNIEPKHQLTRLECRRPKVCRHHKNFWGTSRRTVFGCKGCGLQMCEQCYPRAHPNYIHALLYVDVRMITLDILFCKDCT